MLASYYQNSNILCAIYRDGVVRCYFTVFFIESAVIFYFGKEYSPKSLSKSLKFLMFLFSLNNFQNLGIQNFVDSNLNSYHFCHVLDKILINKVFHKISGCLLYNFFCYLVISRLQSFRIRIFKCSVKRFKRLLLKLLSIHFSVVT